MTPKEEAAEPEIKPCPFCGHPAKTLRYNGATQVTCASPMTECAGFDVVAPVAMWNRRAVPPQPSGEVERMREALISIREECNNAGKWSDIVMERMIERIELEAIAALNGGESNG